MKEVNGEGGEGKRRGEEEGVREMQCKREKVKMGRKRSSDVQREVQKLGGEIVGGDFAWQM